MVYKTRRCKYCDKGGAYSFNHLCSFHWEKQINENIKNFVEAEKTKKGTN